MCGICCSVLFSLPDKWAESSDYSSIDEEHIERFKRRGPDCFKGESSQFEDKASLSFCSSVLHLRGSNIVPQPYKDQKGNLLLWNGEILEDQTQAILGGNSDTEFLCSSLSSCKDTADFLNVFGQIRGPWAFIYWQVDKGLLWFGRDVFGRRSLLFCASQSPNLCFTLSSLALSTEKWIEVPADGIYCLDVSRSKAEKCHVIIKYKWSKSISGCALQSSECTFGENVLFRIITSDCVIASPIKSSLNTSIPQTFPDYYMKNTSSSETAADKVFQSLLGEEVIYSVVSEFETYLSCAVQRRVQNQPFLCKDCMKSYTIHHKGSLHFSVDLTHEEIQRTKCTHSSVGVLFSGGIDSLVIAALVHRFVPPTVPVDLMNVAFYSHKLRKNPKHAGKQSTDFNYEVPDRITGKQGVKALRNLYSSRHWNFIEVNVNQEELEKIRSQHICHILKPSYTVLDDSIGCACWFAARGKGLLNIDGKQQEYTSPSRVLLLGMGADEQLAGYSRHRAKFCSNGWQGVNGELALELDRISSRNLGRDDRIISDHGREARFPFLDENVVSFLNEKPIWLKANLNYSRGIGEKLLLRLLAYKIGLKEASVLPKRAIQFGSRIARIENSHEKGSDHCHRLHCAVQQNYSEK